MNSSNRVLKFQLLSYLKSLVISILVGIAITVILNTIFANSFGEKNITLVDILLSSGFIVMLVFTVMLIVQCFMCYFEDYRFSTRLGITRKNFFSGNLKFFIIMILIYSIVATIIGSSFLKNSTVIDYIAETVISEMDEDSVEKFNKEEISNVIEEKKTELVTRGFIPLFKNSLTFITGFVGFWLIIGFLIFALQGKAIVAIPIFVALMSFLPSDICTMSTHHFKGVTLFVISQLLIRFGMNYVEERV